MNSVEDKKLYLKVKKEADFKFEAKTGIYKSAWIVKRYKNLGGRYVGEKPNKTTGIQRWFEEKWINLFSKNKNGEYAQCGRQNKSDKYPLCRPLKRITNNTPKTVNELSKESINKAKKEKISSKRIKFS